MPKPRSLQAAIPSRGIFSSIRWPPSWTLSTPLVSFSAWRFFGEIAAGRKRFARHTPRLSCLRASPLPNPRRAYFHLYDGLGHCHPRRGLGDPHLPMALQLVDAADPAVGCRSFPCPSAHGFAARHVSHRTANCREIAIAEPYPPTRCDAGVFCNGECYTIGLSLKVGGI